MTVREPFQKIIVSQKSCIHVYGVAPCSAALGVTGDSKCYNTRATCQDRESYLEIATPITFCKQNENMPRDEGPMIPSVVSVSTNPTTLNIAASSVDQGPLGRRASVKVTLMDHPYHDRLTDPYWRDRDFNGADRSTFWSKWLVRNPYYKGSRLQIIDTDIAGNLADRTREYVIDRIDWASNGKVTITAKDILAPLSETMCPVVTSGTLTAGITDVQTAFLMDGHDEYPASGYIRIDDEIMSYTRVVNSFTVVRAQGGTVAEAHDAETPIQLCAYFNARVDDVLEELLVDYGNVDPSFVNVASQWTIETNKWGTPYQLETIISEPTKVSQLVGEILEECSLSIWWDEVQQVIPLKFVRPVDSELDTVTLLNGDQHVKINSVEIRPRPEQRVDQVWFYYGMYNFAEDRDNPTNYARVRVTVAAEAAENFEGQPAAVRQIFSRWLTDGQLGTVVTTSTRILQRLSNMPRDISFALDAKDRDVWTGDTVELTVRALIDFNGEQLPTMLQVTSAEDSEDGHSVEYVARDVGLAQRGAYIVPNDYPVYSLATSSQRAVGCWIAENDGLMPNGDPGYLLS